MNEQKLPTQFELCQIAAILLRSNAVKRPMRAVRAALGLWLSAGYESIEQRREAAKITFGNTVKTAAKIRQP